MDLLNIPVDDGKYTLIQREGGDGEILRHGEPWIAPLCNVNASKMILAMGYELERLREVARVAALLASEVQDQRDSDDPDWSGMGDWADELAVLMPEAVAAHRAPADR